MVTPHEYVIHKLKEAHNLQTTGFKKALKVVEGNFKWLKVIPDCYSISNGLVLVYEVEDTHRVSYDKLMTYARLWKELDAVEWELRLVIVDIRGGRLEPDLAIVYYHG